jgi:hypothetical protein
MSIFLISSVSIIVSIILSGSSVHISIDSIESVALINKNYYILKPIEINELIKRVNTIIATNLDGYS